MNTETKHTPGPWGVHEPSQKTTLNESRLLVTHPDGERVIACLSCGYCGGHGETPEAERKANSHLIAAAPDLLEALNYGRSMAILNPPAGISKELWETFWAKADAAIDKAEGKDSQ